MKNVQKIDLGLTGYDELFANDEERKVNKLPRIFDIPISEIDDFPDHPFKVKIDEDMDQLVQSIKERGIITPVTLRPKEDGRYEIVSGHRRKKACELAGLDTVKAEVREMSRDEAIILMVESNLQRSTILPSEKAFSYKMRLEAMNRQGQRTDLTSSPVGIKLQGKQSLEIVGESAGDSRNQVHRYIRLTELVQPLLDLVDEGRIAFRPAVELSYLKKEEQEALVEEISYADATPSLAQATEDDGKPYSHHVSNGTYDSALQLTGYDPVMASIRSYDFADAAKQTVFFQKIMPSMKDYYETEHYIFVHGWIPCLRDRGSYSYTGDWRTAENLWPEARWLNGMEVSRHVAEDGKTIVCGHWHASYGHSVMEGKGSEFGPDANFSPFYGQGVIALDACTAVSGFVNCIVIED